MEREKEIMQKAWNAASSAIYNADYALSNCYHGTRDDHDLWIDEMRAFLKTLDSFTGRWPEYSKVVHRS